MFKSVYEVKITGKDIRRFIKKLYKFRIYIIDINIMGKSAYLKLDKDNYKRLLEVKTIYEIEVIRLYGIVKIIDFIKNNLFFLICISIGFIFLIFMSNIIYDVNVIHSNKEIRDIIYRDLKYNEIKKYSFIKTYDKKEEIEKDILKKHKDKIEWLEIERVGVRYIVRVEERIIKEKEKTKTPRNIVSIKDGIIMKIEASSGEIKKKVGDYVKKGDIIISGSITKNDEVKNKVAAQGNVYAEVWYKVSVDMPYYYKEINYLGETRKIFKIKILNKNIDLFQFKKFDTYKEKELFSVKNNILPIRLSFSSIEKTKVIEEIYTVEEAITESVKISDNRIKMGLKNNEKILSSRVIKKEEHENYISIVLFYKVMESIGLEEEIK